MNGSRMIGEVRIVGAGLLGASVGLGLRALGVDVIVHDHVALEPQSRH
jgi:prephenate dehydrogenase